MTGTIPPELSDEQLIGLIRDDAAGPEGRAAASALFARHQRRVYLWSYRYVRDHERALELAQDALLNAWRALPSFEGRSRFSSWLFAITRNRCLKALAAPGLLRDTEIEPDQTEDPGGSPDVLVEQMDDERRLRALLEEHLDAHEREALWLRCFDRMPVETITEVLKLDNATGARALLQRARRKLRAALEREQGRRGR
jgi:RNA polymerase sigma-70 factor (ECF subfamily)